MLSSKLFSNFKDCDGNGNVKKTIGLMSKTTTLHLHHAFCVFLCLHCTATKFKMMRILFFSDVFMDVALSDRKVSITISTGTGV